MKRQPLGQAEKWCLRATFVSGALLIAAPIWWNRHNDDVVVAFPLVTMPSPNARDYFQAAAQKTVCDRQIEYSMRDYVAPDEFPVLPKTLLPTSPQNGPAPSAAKMPTQKRAYTADEKRRLLQFNAPALKTLRDGFAYHFLQPPAFKDTTPGGSWTDFRAQRHLSSLLRLKSQLQQAHGDWSGALQSSLDGMRLGTDIRRGGTTICSIMSAAIESETRRAAWPTLAHLTAPQAKNAQLRLQKLQDDRAPLWANLEQEKWVTQAQMLQAFRDSNWRKMLSTDPSRNQEIGFRTSWQRAFASKQEVIDATARYYDTEIAKAHLSYPKQLAQNAKPDELVANIVANYLNYSNDGQDAIAQQAQSTLLLTALALQRFKIERGVFPQKLGELVPRYLKKVPLDAFSDGQTLRYKLQPIRCISAFRQVPTGKMIANVNAPPAYTTRNEKRSVTVKPPQIPETKTQIEYSMWPYTLYSIGFRACS